MSHLTHLQTQLNRLNAQKVALVNKLKNISKKERKARTRTLIQIGGLINMLGLPAYCEIEMGDDLQCDLINQDKAAILLGMLISLQEQLPPQLPLAQINEFKRKGIRYMKGQVYAK